MNRTSDLFPRSPRRMKQPRKDVLRDQLALAAEEIERLRVENEAFRHRPWTAVAAWVRTWRASR